MFFSFKLRYKAIISIAAVLMITFLAVVISVSRNGEMYTVNTDGKKYIKWVDFNVTVHAMKDAIEADISSHAAGGATNWIELLAYLGAKYGGDFSKYKSADLKKLVQELAGGAVIEELTSGMKYYSYYLEAYTAVLGGFVGEYEVLHDNGDGVEVWEKEYGIKAYSPIAKGYEYSDYDDFGNGRDYGYARKHFGHDLMALTGTPVIAVESGVVEVMGWNQYGGWRIGIRSFDGRRYYYYAHLRQNRPFAEGLEAGQVVMAGDVIGYVGRTGYSLKENTNGIKQSHLHYGLQLIFDESQKEGVNQIWVDLYEITRLLSTRRTATQRNAETKEHTRVIQTREAVPENRFVPSDKPPEEPDAGDEAPDTENDPVDADVEDARQAEVPVLMYHDIFKDLARQSTYTITPVKFEQDLKFLKSNHYTCITVDDMVNFVEKGKPLPEKPVMITFDDGHFNNIYYAQPLLEEYEMSAVIFVVGTFCERGTREGVENPNYSYITWQRISEMAKGSVWDIQSHSWDMHGEGLNGTRFGTGRKNGESTENYFNALCADADMITKALTNSAGKRPIAFAYPFGKLDDTVEQALQQAGYKATFCSNNGKAVLVQGRPETLHYIRRLARTNNKSAAQLIGN